MSAKNIVQEIKELVTEFFGDVVPTPPAPAAPAAPAPAKLSTEYETKDGSKVEIDTLAPGGVVMIDGAPGLPGELELADGTKLVIAENGVIAEVMAGGTPAAPEAPEDMGSKFAAFESLASGKFQEYETKFAAYENRFAEYENKFAQYKQIIDKLLNLSQILVDAPAAQPDPVVKGGAFKDQSTKKVSDILFS